MAAKAERCGAVACSDRAAIAKKGNRTTSVDANPRFGGVSLWPPTRAGSLESCERDLLIHFYRQTPAIAVRARSGEGGMRLRRQRPALPRLPDQPLDMIGPHLQRLPLLFVVGVAVIDFRDAGH